MPNTGFIHLSCHSEYSITDSLIRVSELAKQAKNHQFDAIALTDRANLFGCVKFYQAAIKAGVKPIFGAELRLQDDKDHNKYASVLVLCQNHQGYVGLCELISNAYIQEQSLAGAHITPAQLVQYQKGLILISLPVDGDIAQCLLNDEMNKATQTARFWQSVFGDRFYLAGQRTQRKNDERHLHLCVKLGLALDIPLVAINRVQFIHKTNYAAHEARICIAEGEILDNKRRKRRFSPEQFLKSPAEMCELFADLPELLENTVEISKRCNVHFALYGKNYLPNFPVPEGVTMAQFFTQAANAGLDQHLQQHSPPETSNQSPEAQIDARKIYTDRLAFELAVIIKMDFAGYFLIVADFIRWSKDHDIPVGPGRGSGAGSLVAYALGITSVDPIQHGLLFERFLNPERVSMPDFDIDFCTDRRDEVIAYVAQKYGSEKVSQIITYGTMAAKGVVRDVGRVLGHPYGFSDKLSKMIPNDLKINLSRALGRFNDDDSAEDQAKWYSPELKEKYDSEESVATLIDLSLQLEGLIRNVGTHAGGVVIAPSKISNFCPVYKGSGANDSVVSQFDKDDVEAVGLVKFDFLGLSNLTVIDKTLKMIVAKKLSDAPIDFDTIPLDDAAVYKLLQNCNTTGVFQLESEGMRNYLGKLQADSFEDIVAMLALYRPGPLDAGMVDDYISVKRGKQAVKYPHPMLEAILKPTNGVFLYQEQVMRSAQVLAGYSLGEADLLRRAMGKKKVKEMEAQREVFVQGAAGNNIDAQKANEIFDLIDKFSGYGFNKSHSVAYAYISYQTAWLKAHYPAAFMAAVLSGMMDDSDRVATTVFEVKSMGLVLNQPNVCQSDYVFSIQDAQTLFYGLGAIKGIGEALVRAVILERQARGDYKDLFDFCLRIERKYLNKRALEALIYSGAFDVFGVSRASLFATYPKAFKQADQQQTSAATGQCGLFADASAHVEYEREYVKQADFSFKETLNFEKLVMGYYFYNHPVDEYQADLEYLNATLPEKIAFRNNKDVRVLALISEVRYYNTRNGQMAGMTMKGKSAQIDAVVFSKALAKVSDQLVEDTIVVIAGKLGKNFRDEPQIVVETVEPIDALKIQYARCVEIRLNQSHTALFEPLSELLQQHAGRCSVKLYYACAGLEGQFPLGKTYRVCPNEPLIEAIDQLIGSGAGVICYR